MCSLKEIRVELKTLVQILSEKPLSVPNYQRRYSWNIAQRETLIKDIFEHYKSENRIIDSYFCGSLILEFSTSEYLYLSDGQQRITTFLIILKSLLQFKEVETSSVSDEIISILDDAKKGSFRFSDTKQDNEFQECLSDKSNDLTSNFDVAYKQVTTIFEAMPSSEYAEFAYHLLHLTNFSVTLAPSNSGLFLFERSNNRGLPLSLTDKCKSIVFNYASDIQSVSKRWESFLIHCQETDRTTDTHILNYLWSVDGIRVTATSGLVSFRSLISDRSDELVRDLEHYAIYTSKIYKCYVPGAEVVCRNFRHLDCLKKQYQVRAVMSATRNLDKASQVNILEELEKTAMTIAIASPLPSEVTPRLCEIMVCLDEKKISECCEILRNYRSALAYEIDDFIRYTTSSKSIQVARGLLYFLEAYLQRVATGRQSSAESLNGTIEHILPQSKRTLSTPEVDLIGNLTLLEQSINSHIGNSSFDERREVYKIQSYLLTQSLIIDYPVASRNEILRPLLYKADSKWTKKDIHKRGKMMSQLASKVLDYDYVEAADRTVLVQQKFDVPQANNLTNVFATLIAVAAGNTTTTDIYEFHKTRIDQEIKPRETGYCLQALEILELIDQEEEITLTAQGKEAAGLEYEDFVRDVVAQHPLIVTLSQMTVSECINFIERHSDIGAATRERRYQCLQHWFRECGLEVPSQSMHLSL